jgi:hypothetical protein
MKGRYAEDQSARVVTKKILTSLEAPFFIGRIPLRIVNEAEEGG